MKIETTIKLEFEDTREAKALLGMLMVARKALTQDADEYREQFGKSGISFDHRSWLDSNIERLRRLLP